MLDPSAIDEALRDLSATPEARVRLGTHAQLRRAIMRLNSSNDQQVATYTAAYRQALRERRRTPGASRLGLA